MTASRSSRTATRIPRPACCLAGALFLLAAATGCATNPVTGESDFVLLSEAEEIELGERYHDRILAQYDRYADEDMQAYVERLGQRLASKSHRPELEYHFTVLDDPAVNAFALPGGYVYVTRGIMAYFNSEAELAGVLGHEIGHVTARHSVQRYSAATATGVLGTLLLAGAGAGQAGAELFRTVQLAAIRGYGREQELQADRLGAQYLARTGYDPDAMLEVIELLADQEAYEVARAKAEGREPNVYHGIFATHPENDARLQRVVRAARKYAGEIERPPGRAAYLRRLDGMTFGPGSEQGLVVDGTFLHLGLDAALSAPPGWTIDNRPDRLIFEAPEDDGRVVATLDALDEAPESPASLLRARTPGVNLGEGRAFEARTGSGYTAVAVQRTPVGDRRVRHAIVVRAGQAWYFAGYSDSGTGFEAFSERFLAIASSLHALDDTERERARPLRLRVIEPTPGATWEELAAAVPARVADPVARLRLLNGAYPDEPVPDGLVKTLE